MKIELLQNDYLRAITGVLANNANYFNSLLVLKKTAAESYHLLEETCSRPCINAVKVTISIGTMSTIHIQILLDKDACQTQK